MAVVSKSTMQPNRRLTSRSTWLVACVILSLLVVFNYSSGPDLAYRDDLKGGVSSSLVVPKSDVQVGSPGSKQQRFFHHAVARASGRSGVTIHDMLLCHAHAWHMGGIYGGACGEGDYSEHKALLTAIGLEEEVPFACTRDYHDGIRGSVVQRREYEREDTRVWIPEYVGYLKSRVKYPEKDPNVFTIVVHIRRGKTVSPCKPQHEGYDRYLPNSHYQRLIDKYNERDAKVIIFSQSESDVESFDEFEAKGYEIHLSHELTEVWEHIIVADVVILSRSSFSLIPAVIAKGTVVYTPFWHKPLSDWHVVRDEEILAALDEDNKRLKEAKCPAKKAG